MREIADRARIEHLMEAFGREARSDVRIFLVGGCTAVLMGWRASTVDVDLVMRPESDSILRAIPDLKERLHVNIELASPVDFIPVPRGWEERGIFIARHGRVAFFHFEMYAQALAKIERGHERDVADVAEMISRGLIGRDGLTEYFGRIEPELYRFPAIDPVAFREAVQLMKWPEIGT